MEYYTITMAADLIGMHPSYLRKLATAGEIQCNKIANNRGRYGFIYMVPEDEVERLMAVREGHGALVKGKRTVDIPEKKEKSEPVKVVSGIVNELNTSSEDRGKELADMYAKGFEAGMARAFDICTRLMKTGGFKL